MSLWDRFRENYDRIALEAAWPTQEMRTLRSIVKLCHELLGFPSARILDLGSGPGYITSDLSRHLVCVDISRINLEAIPTNRSAVQAVCEALPFKDESFDEIVFTDVLEHLLYPTQAAMEISRVLKPLGFLFLSCPWEQDLKVYSDPRYKQKYEFVHLWSINFRFLRKIFPNFYILASTTITNQVPRQFAPYEIKFFLMQKGAANENLL